MKREVFDWLKEVGLSKEDGVVVAVSGGPDSIALLHLLYRFRLEEVPIRLYIAHLHHGLRASADRDEVFVRDLAEFLGISYFPVFYDVAKVAEETGTSVETAGRRLRYAHFAAVQKQTDSRYLATGHHKDDQIESILLHGIRGSGIDGLVGMHRMKGHLLRPLLPYDKEEIEALLASQGIPFCIDETNEQTRYTRNFIRHEVVPLLAKINPSVTSSISTLSSNAADAQMIVTEAVERFFSKYREGAGEIVLDSEAFSVESGAMKRAIIRACVVELKGDADGFSRAQTLEIERVWGSRTGAQRALLGLLFAVTQEGLLVKRIRDEAPGFRIPANEPGLIRIGDFSIQMEQVAREEIGSLTDPDILYVSEEETKDLVFRGREPDDYIQPFGMQGTKKMSVAMVDLKLRADHRDSWPLLSRGNEVLWIPGYQKSEKTRVGADAHYIRYHFKREE